MSSIMSPSFSHVILPPKSENAHACIEEWGFSFSCLSDLTSDLGGTIADHIIGACMKFRNVWGNDSWINLKKFTKSVHREIIQENSDIRKSFLNHFSFDVGKFSDHMAKAFQEWKTFDDKKKMGIGKKLQFAILYLAITLNIPSMKLFITGNPIASGNTHRQVLESIALAFSVF